MAIKDNSGVANMCLNDITGPCMGATGFWQHWTPENIIWNKRPTPSYNIYFPEEVTSITFSRISKEPYVTLNENKITARLYSTSTPAGYSKFYQLNGSSDNMSKTNVKDGYILFYDDDITISGELAEGYYFTNSPNLITKVSVYPATLSLNTWYWNTTYNTVRYRFKITENTSTAIYCNKTSRAPILTFNWAAQYPYYGEDGYYGGATWMYPNGSLWLKYTYQGIERTVYFQFPSSRDTWSDHTVAVFPCDYGSTYGFYFGTQNQHPEARWKINSGSYTEQSPQNKTINSDTTVTLTATTL